MTDRLDELFLAEDASPTVAAPPSGGDELLFAADDAAPAGAMPAPAAAGRWKILVADDDREVHSLTSLVLSDYSFEGRRLEFLHAESGAETVAVLNDHPDTALVLLDVVMESDDAGLQAVRRIREELGNSFVRIILRTGQPGQAPEQEVVSGYDINDYKAKTELTAQKLSTTVTSALRSYRDIRAIERNRVGLERINGASGPLLKCQTPEDLAALALASSSDLLTAADGAAGVSGFFVSGDDHDAVLLAGLGAYADLVGRAESEALPDDVRYRIQDALHRRDPNAADWGYAVSFASRSGARGRLVLEYDRVPDKAEVGLLDVLTANVAAAYDNIHLNREILKTQHEMILTLGEVVESRSKETANHVKRVGSYARLLAVLAGLPEAEADLLQQAAPLHDVGKIGVPDAVLMKPGRYDDRERRIMMEHARIGWEILRNSKRELFQMAAIVAHEHHERWDGGGYPRGLAGEDIHIYGRIVAIVDVYDALSHARVYKPALPLEECLELIREGRGTHFDPRLTDLFLANVERFEQIGQELRDDPAESAYQVDVENMPV